MGNQLVGIAPSQIYPVEHYLTELPDLKFDISMGSTRFLKVARAESQEGLIVVKVFAIHDPSLPLQPYKDRLEDIRVKLSSAVNCLPFQKILVNDRAGLIIREYAKYSLYDRISTRPFLSVIEKKWITFQVLYALHQCHKVGVCHGDIKLENITITSWNWILLVDFASFKPTFLPEDNPADYSYFFDTSRRRTCYIAPERFMKTLNSDSLSILTETFCKPGELKPAMDIFSAGCALLELWNEGNPVFDLSQLLAYRSGDYSPQKHLDKIEDPLLRSLLSSMMQRDPSQRLSAELYLSQERGRLFPEYFYTFLQPYMQIFSSSPILSSDEKITRLKKDIKSVFSFLQTGSSKEEESESTSENEKSDFEKPLGKDDNGLVIITSLVTSCIRGLHDCTTKIESLEILLFLAAHANEETILDRILPYILFLSKDQNPRVKVAAIHSVTQCLSFIKKVPRSDANIFPEYILPELSPLATDSNTCVRVAYAKNIATLAEIAVRFLEQTQTDWYDKVYSGKQHSGASRINYEVELQTLHEMVQQSVSSLLTDAQSLVKQTLMHYSITKLCVFFGKQKANDVLLSHIITFLNDKEDKELRGAFFSCIVGVAAYIGWHCSSILTPLLLQGLTDCSEFVTTKSINAMSSLTELGLITKQSLCELVNEYSPFLVHPSLWVRLAVVGFIATVAKILTILDVQCKIMPILSMYMKYPLIQIERTELVLESLVTPIPRNVFDSVIKYSDIDLLFETLRERQNSRLVVSSGRIPSYTEMNPSLKSLFRRLIAEGMTDSIEDYLLMMSNHLKKIHKHKTSADAKHNKQTEGKIEINSNVSNVCTNVFNLAEGRGKIEFLHKKISQGNQSTTNADWTMFNITNSDQSNSGGSLSKLNLESRSTSPTPDSHHQFSSSNTGNFSLHERSYIQYRSPNCSLELKNLLARQQMHYLKASRSKEWSEQAAWQPQLPPPGWRLRGSLVAHLYEHRGAVTSLSVFPSSSLFASASVDGFIRIWDCGKMEGRNIANRSKQSYRTAGSVAAMTVCENGQSLAAATHDGSIVVVRVDSSNSKMSLAQSRQVDPDEDGCAVDVQCFDSGPQNLLVYATLYGSIVGWDLRAPGTAWRLENGLKNGVITTFCLDYHHNWLALGTSSGYHIAWDMRFQLPITSIVHPSGPRIRKVISHPTEHSWIISSVQGNNEISMWNLETGFRQCVLWGSSSPPLSKTHMTNHSVCAMLSGCIDRSGFLLAGGTDQRMRFWNLHSPSDSYLVIPSPSDNFCGTSLTYKHRLIDGTSVIQEIVEQYSVSHGTGNKSDEVPRAGPEPPPPGHRDCISDVALCKASQCFLLSASRDGIIKVWK